MAIYIEHWEVLDNPYGNRIDFAYSDEQREQGLVGFMRDEHFEESEWFKAKKGRSRR